jgi:hormone-sensitive lipase
LYLKVGFADACYLVQIYLRQWAKDTGAPVLSIDYSLAPEAPFPRQMEEVFFAYCWALKNAHLLGNI